MHCRTHLYETTKFTAFDLKTKGKPHRWIGPPPAPCKTCLTDGPDFGGRASPRIRRAEPWNNAPVKPPQDKDEIGEIFKPWELVCSEKGVTKGQHMSWAKIMLINFIVPKQIGWPCLGA